MNPSNPLWFGIHHTRWKWLLTEATVERLRRNHRRLLNVGEEAIYPTIRNPRHILSPKIPKAANPRQREVPASPENVVVAANVADGVLHEGGALMTQTIAVRVKTVIVNQRGHPGKLRMKRSLSIWPRKLRRRYSFFFGYLGLFYYLNYSGWGLEVNFLVLIGNASC